jgi:hypothetical protein
VDPIALTAKMSESTFSEMMAASPRQVREILYAQLGIKNKSKSLLKNLQQKKEERVHHLHEILKTSTSKRQADVVKELIRNWLYTKRPMLKAALDHLGVANDNGLIESDPDCFQKLSKQQVDELISHLSKTFDRDHVVTYLRFVETPHIEG